MRSDVTSPGGESVKRVETGRELDGNRAGTRRQEGGNRAGVRSKEQGVRSKE